MCVSVPSIPTVQRHDLSPWQLCAPAQSVGTAIMEWLSNWRDRRSIYICLFPRTFTAVGHMTRGAQLATFDWTPVEATQVGLNINRTNTQTNINTQMQPLSSSAIPWYEFQRTGLTFPHNTLI